MGLLDDAIREHLDLKRARGADPAEVERMEREALGPVRREPTFGSTRFDAAQPRSPRAREPEYYDEQASEFEHLQDLGYHDSTAPHPHEHHEHARDEHVHPHREQAPERFDFEDEYLEPDDLAPRLEQVEQPRRRFLRRSRAAAERAPEEFGHHDDLDATRAHDLFEEHESAEPVGPPPPHLQFEHPPKRPRFTAEPPSSYPEAEDQPEPHSESVHQAPEPAPAAPTPQAPEASRPGGPPAADLDAQETTEFDVQQHLAEAPRQEGEDEDVLEETPDFLQDTPEHDRLWFEQRPPRDFDFDG